MQFLKFHLSILLLTVIVTFINGQNLIPNPSFENITQPLLCNSLYSSKDGFNNTINNWTSPNYATPDILSQLVNSACVTHAYPNTSSQSIGEQLPKTGNSMAGIILYTGLPDYREYIQAKLNSPLVKGKTYKVSFFVSLGEKSKVVINNIGIHFSNLPVSNNSEHYLSYIPQIEFNQFVNNDKVWTELASTFVASDNYEYITIGNFRNDASTFKINNSAGFYDVSYYFIDDISLSIINPEISGDSIICEGETIQLKALNTTSYQWALASDPGTIISNDSVLTVSPSNDTEYLLFTSNDTLSWIVKVSYPINFSLGNDAIICKNEQLQLSIAGSVANHRWSNGSTESSITVKEPGIYWLQVNNEACVTYDSIKIEWCSCNVDITMPNLITTNKDSLNDSFKPITVDIDCYDSINLLIFNRWGERVFESSELEWTPPNISPGIYFFEIKAIELNGKKISKKGILDVKINLE